MMTTEKCKCVAYLRSQWQCRLYTRRR